MRLPTSARLLLALGAALLVTTAWLGAPATAEVLSPTISPSRIHVDDPIRQGSTVRLPGLAVTNQGAEAARYRMTVSPVRDDGVVPLDASWVRLQPESFELAGGEAMVVAVWLVVPGDATPGAYRGRLRATVEPSAPGEGIAVTVRAAVASDLRFAVVEHHERLLDSLVAWFGLYRWWLAAAVAVYSSTLLAPSLWRRYAFRSPIVRRDRGGG